MAEVERYRGPGSTGKWLFPGTRPNRHITARTAQHIVEFALGFPCFSDTGLSSFP